jgi:hypothetical protein
MKFRIGSSLLFLSVATVVAGDSPSSAKDALDLDPRAYLPSAKEAFTPSPKSAKDAKDILLPPLSRTRWTLGAGLSLRNIGAIDFKTGVTNLTIPMLYQAGNTPVPGIGAPTGLAPRAYNDGFVRPDARSPNIGRTSDFGYQNAATQITGNTLSYQATGGERRDVMRTTSSAATGWSDDRDWELAPYLKLSQLTDLGNGWSAGPTIHFNFTSIEGSRNGLNTILGREQLDIYDVAATDAYDTSGLILPLGNFIGAPNIPNSPLLPAVPASRTLTPTLRSTDVAQWTDSINESLDVNVWGLSLGAEAAYQANNKFYATIGAGFALNVTDWEAQRSDRVLQQINNGPPTQISSRNARNIGSSILWGFYLQSAAGYQVTKEFSVEANLRYDLTEELSGKVGNSSFEVDLSGFSVGLGGNYTFW